MWQATDTAWSGGTELAGGAGVHAGLGQQHLMRVFDEIDYGMLIIDAQGRILHANHLARHELAAGRVIMSYGNSLLGSNAEHTSRIQQAMESSFRGQRKLLMMSAGDKELALAFTPLSHPLEADAPSVLVLLSRQNTCDNLAVRMFARALNLSPSEESVLMGLCRGLAIAEIAEQHGVAESTVRSQIKTLREKAGAPSIRSLLHRVNSLPPVVPALRIITPMPHNATEFSHP
ncbi:MAG: LuxR C-terminal-related transcriptional regulator [Hydrogenophaga sp.]|jgi:DNA-binding CsgD family transcriptional regulator|uniref:helix-turn-helix transcriptional regulator n=1 Tax=Hydrogenophaga sp. TaxID=1904254 RepID=UPI00260B2C58|nr:LuxR C-terminal-related transcriptional regulator [Hydrogenophaga sp.]MCV0440211.1 LuxR C-terminal-related transcriptional regulator [Hydrogenophaga sp.]